MNIFKTFRKWWDKAQDEEKEAIVHAQSGDYPIPLKLRRRSFKQVFPDIRMQRGVEAAKRRKQLPRRMNFIWNSMMQANDIARWRRTAMKNDREHGGHAFMETFRKGQKGTMQCDEPS